jgi:hypothetical protein
MLATVSERIRKIPSRISGESERRSMTTNAVSRAIATAARPSVRAEPQPKLSALTIAKRARSARP